MVEITDTARLEVLARSLASITVYEGACRVQFQSDNKREVPWPFGKKSKRKIIRVGCDVAFLREVADGLLKGELVYGPKDTVGLRG